MGRGVAPDLAGSPWPRHRLSRRNSADPDRRTRHHRPPQSRRIGRSAAGVSFGPKTVHRATERWPTPGGDSRDPMNGVRRDPRPRAGAWMEILRELGEEAREHRFEVAPRSRRRAPRCSRGAGGGARPPQGLGRTPTRRSRPSGSAAEPPTARGGLGHDARHPRSLQLDGQDASVRGGDQGGRHPARDRRRAGSRSAPPRRSDREALREAGIEVLIDPARLRLEVVSPHFLAWNDFERRRRRSRAVDAREVGQLSPGTSRRRRARSGGRDAGSPAPPRSTRSTSCAPAWTRS